MSHHKVHDLKTCPEPFEAQRLKVKTHEFRRDDRDFAVGDILRLREWLPDMGHFSGATLLVEVTYLTRGPAFDVPVGFVVLSTRLLA